METMNVDEANKVIDKAAGELMKKIKGKLGPKFSQASIRKELKSCFAELLLKKVVVIPSQETETGTEKAIQRPKANSKKRDESPLHFPPMEADGIR